MVKQAEFLLHQVGAAHSVLPGAVEALLDALGPELEPRPPHGVVAACLSSLTAAVKTGGGKDCFVRLFHAALAVISDEHGTWKGEGAHPFPRADRLLASTRYRTGSSAHVCLHFSMYIYV